MARLVLSLDSQVMAEYNMNKERYTIGRLPDNDIRIDNPAVSGHHSLIINILNDSFLEDLGSTNGTLVNGQPIKKHFLQTNDVVELGKYKLKYISDQTSKSAAPQDFEKTMVLRPGAVPKADAPKPSRAEAGRVRRPILSSGRAAAPGARRDSRRAARRCRVCAGTTPASASSRGRQLSTVPSSGHAR